MRRSRFAAFAALAIFLACGDGGHGPSPSTFAGTWDATKMEFTNVANSSQKVDVIALGATFVVVLQSTGNYDWTLVLPGHAPETATGTWSASADVFTMKDTGGSGDRQFGWSLAGNTLSLSGANADFDFNNDNVDDPAKVSLVLVKQ